MMKNDLMEALALLRHLNWRGLFVAPTKNSVLQLGRYIVVGGSAFLVDFGSYCLFGYLGVHYLVAGFSSFVLGFSFNFLVSRWMIFAAAKGKAAVTKELISVLVISLLGLLFTEGLLYLGTDMLGADYRVSKIIASIIVLFWNYFARKIFVYK